MKTNRRWSRIGWLLLPLLATLTIGCVPNLIPLFSHQGRLLDNAGVPVPDGDYQVIYHLYHASSGGTPVYTDTQTVPVQDGLFTASIGDMGAIEPDIFSQPTWMEITVEGEVLTPREQLQGAPYAFSLASGAVIRGTEPITRTFQGVDDTGAVLTVWNIDTSETGGNALLAINAAGATGADRDKVSAFQAIAVDGDANNSSAGLAAIIKSEDYRGMYVQGGTPGETGWFAATFDSAAGIQLIGGGSCLGCLVSYPGINAGSEAIVAGDFVAVVGVETDPDLNVPVMQVRKARDSSDAVIGVATSRMNRAPVGEFHDMTTGGFDPVAGDTAPGDYLLIGVQGLVQANVSADSKLAVGDYLAMTDAGLSKGSAAQPPIGRVMSAVTKDGLAWVMLSGQ